MKSNNGRFTGLFDGAKTRLGSILKRLRSRNILLSNLSATFFSRHSNKTKALREKYRQLKLRKNAAGINRSTLEDTTEHLSIKDNNQFFKKVSGYFSGLKLPQMRLSERLKISNLKISERLRPFKGLKLSERLRLSDRLKLSIGFQAGGLKLYKGFQEKLGNFSLKGAKLDLSGFKAAWQGIFKDKNSFNLKIAVAAVSIFVFGGFIVYENSPVPAYAVQIDGKSVSYVEDRLGAEELLSKIKEEKTVAWKRRIDITQEVTFKESKIKRFKIDKIADLKGKFQSNLTFVAVATAIKANGEVIAVVQDDKTAEQILQDLKNLYENKDVEGDVTLEGIEFKENLELTSVPVSLNEVLSAEEALALIKEGRQKKRVHIVTGGDSLWTIARANDMHVEDLRKANPSLKGERLDIGQELNLVAIEPLINVQATGQVTLTETVPYKVVVETNRSLWRGSEKVKKKGENGLREVTYKVVMVNGSIIDKNVLQENVLKQPIDKVVEKGSKIVVASRGGSGKLGWPIKGQITSNYGRRWGRMHTGLDINGYTGQAIGAAESGTVISAGWQGAYGRMVTVKHDNGLVTRYAHMSKIKVSVGQKVGRGDLLGLVGSTGRSTGSHLHFEVLSGGASRNPMSYLK